MKTVMVSHGNTKYEKFEDQYVHKHPNIVREAMLNAIAEFRDSYGLTWEVRRNDGKQQFSINRVGERVIEIHHPDGSLSYMARYVVPGNSYCGGSGPALQEIEDSYTQQERQLLGLPVKTGARDVGAPEFK